MHIIHLISLFLFCFPPLTGGFFLCFFSVPVFSKTRFGRPMILVGPHKFWSSGNAKNCQRWHCSQSKCKATLFTKNDVIIRTAGEHNHPWCEWWNFYVKGTEKVLVFLCPILKVALFCRQYWCVSWLFFWKLGETIRRNFIICYPNLYKKSIK